MTNRFVTTTIVNQMNLKEALLRRMYGDHNTIYYNSQTVSKQNHPHIN